MVKKRRKYSLGQLVKINWLGHKLKGRVVKIKEPAHNYKKTLYLVDTGIMKYPVTSEDIIQKIT